MRLKKNSLCGYLVCGLIALATTSIIASDMQSFDSLKSNVTTVAARESFLKSLHKDTIEASLALPLNAKNEENWEGAYWGMELCQYRNKTTLNSLKYALSTCAQRSDSFTRASMEAACALYPSQLKNEVETVLRYTKNTKNFSMAVHYLVNLQPKRAKEFSNLSWRKFPSKTYDPMLAQLRLNLEKSFTERLKNRPPLLDILQHPFPQDAPVIFSFQRRDRNYPGLVVIRKQDGNFIRRPDGSMFAVAQLARSLSNCPGYLTNGNTPQGIFSIMGSSASDDNTFIGPTLTLQSVLPIEETVANYFHNKALDSEKWSKELYRNILPVSWRNYIPMYEAYAAGEVGRSGMIMHGTTIDPEFYKGLPYYPNTPSMGCICTLELWSGEDGQCVYSDQLALVNAYLSLNSPNGYLVVVELDNKPQPVVLYEILDNILKAEPKKLN